MNEPEPAIQLPQRVATLEADMRAIKSDLTDIKEAIKTVANRRTEWGTLAAWSSVVIVIIAGMGAAIVAPLAERTAAMREAQGAADIRVTTILGGQVAAAYDKGKYDERLNSHIEAFNKRTAHVDDEFARFDERLQREMRLLNDKTSVELTDLDKRLQGEIARQIAGLGTVQARHDKEFDDRAVMLRNLSDQLARLQEWARMREEQIRPGANPR